ncbi:DUF6984 family protein [Neisseria animaloris]|uniref:DUF6984 domain-containing protein n=1 Tax=Neisseria animaloris TaxID=326522 RepID=A0A448UC86_9NEIS|nr:hypothetical protein [Neisseria animaloris]VEJ21499.1 Uncharacterised protein [Neisseria animaloris]
MEFNKRPLTDDEANLLKILLANKKPQYAQLQTYFSDSVITLDDGGMGSFLFFNEKNEEDNLKIIPISEYQFNDKDDVPVLATLYSYSDGRLYELDIWKVDFSPLLTYPNKK